MSVGCTIRPVHPFPARMAPDLAIAGMMSLPPGSLVLDPMAGSGTVLRHAGELGLNALGYDVDPLAVLMSQVWTAPVDDDVIAGLEEHVLSEVESHRKGRVYLSWIDEDEETHRFVEYWFAKPQQQALRILASILAELRAKRLRHKRRAALNVLQLALSRVIITKDQGASLGRDISHSRPHKTADSSSFDVVAAFRRSLRQVRKLLIETPPPGRVDVSVGDARRLTAVDNATVDAVVTSPPYLNAIDYMRGHRLSLVWFGYSLPELRRIRAGSVGAERAPEHGRAFELFGPILEAMVERRTLRSRHEAMLSRYAEDMYRLSSEVIRVLKPRGRAVLVVGNSCLKGSFIRNSAGVRTAAQMVGLRLVNETERELPANNRYLPIPAIGAAPLSKRMRTETVLTFVKS